MCYYIKVPSAYLGINCRSGTPQVRRYNGLSASLVGNTVTGSVAETFLAEDQPVNRVIQFGGANTFYTILDVSATAIAVFRSTDAGNTWTNVFQVTVPSNTGRLKSGLNILYANGTPTLVFTAYTAGTTIQGFRSTNGTTWVSDSTVIVTAANTSLTNSPISETVFGGTLYWTGNFGGNVTGGIVAYSPGSISFTTTGSVYLSSSGGATSLCVFNNSLMVLGIGVAAGTSTQRPLSIFEGGSVAQVVNLATVTSGFNAGWKTSMFVDGDYLYCFVPKGPTGTWGCYRVDSTYAVTEVTSTVLPFGMTNSSIIAGARSLSWVDGQVDPGANPTKYLNFANGSVTGTPMVLYRWIDGSTRMEAIDNGATVTDALSLNKNVEGSTFWTSGENHIELVGRSAVSGGTRLLFNLYSGTGGTPTVNVRVWYGERLEEYPTNPATLTNPTSGAITGGGFINSGVVINNGAATYEVTWDTVTDGVTIGDRIIVVLEVFV